MKFITTTVIVVAFTVSDNKKDAAKNTSNHADSVPAYSHYNMPANNSSSISTEV